MGSVFLFLGAKNSIFQNVLLNAYWYRSCKILQDLLLDLAYSSNLQALARSCHLLSLSKSSCKNRFMGYCLDRPDLTSVRHTWWYHILEDIAQDKTHQNQKNFAENKHNPIELNSNKFRDFCSISNTWDNNIRIFHLSSSVNII